MCDLCIGYGGYCGSCDGSYWLGPEEPVTAEPSPKGQWYTVKAVEFADDCATIESDWHLAQFWVEKPVSENELKVVSKALRSGYNWRTYMDYIYVIPSEFSNDIKALSKEQMSLVRDLLG